MLVSGPAVAVVTMLFTSPTEEGRPVPVTLPREELSELAPGIFFKAAFPDVIAVFMIPVFILSCGGTFSEDVCAFPLVSIFMPKYLSTGDRKLNSPAERSALQYRNMKNPNAATKKMLPTMMGIKTSSWRKSSIVDGRGGAGEGGGDGGGDS